MTAEHAPVAVFAFRRPDHLAATLASLAAANGAEQTHLRVFCDGARSASEQPDVDRVRQLARTLEGFASVTVVEREVNMGLAASIIDGVGAMLEEHESVVVLEDDMLVSPDFLDYLNQGITLYREEPNVVSIHAFCVVADEELPQSFFLRGADCWGWATWRSGWSTFDPDGAALLARLDASGLARSFDYDGAYPYRQMLVDQVAGRVDSWAIRWYASAFLADKLTLYPGRSLVRNIGQDGTGTHSGVSASHQVPATRMDLPLRRIEPAASAQGRDAVIRALGDSHRSGVLGRIKRALRGGT